MSACAIARCGRYGATRRRGLCLDHFDQLYGDEDEGPAVEPGLLTPAEMTALAAQVEEAALPLFLAAVLHLAAGAIR